VTSTSKEKTNKRRTKLKNTEEYEEKGEVGGYEESIRLKSSSEEEKVSVKNKSRQTTLRKLESVDYLGESGGGPKGALRKRGVMCWGPSSLVGSVRNAPKGKVHGGSAGVNQGNERNADKSCFQKGKERERRERRREGVNFINNQKSMWGGTEKGNQAVL